MKKDKNEGIPATAYAPLDDIQKLKKLITILADKAAKGVFQ
jgi:hypothetical protein